jgi:hypothetical protein
MRPPFLCIDTPRAVLALLLTLFGNPFKKCESKELFCEDAAFSFGRIF